MTEKLVCVMTTIQEPTPSVRALVSALAKAGAGLVVVGDKKGPARFNVSAELPGSHFLPLEEQQGLPYELAGPLPVGHYARKNLGYLLAIESGATCLYETDDDNAPNGFWAPREPVISVRTVEGQGGAGERGGWVNVYRLFTDGLIWPRGLPLDEIRKPAPALAAGGVKGVRCPVQQGLADLAPDVDAVWRLVLDRDFSFDRRESVWLGEGQWCPFNSQTTWWWPEAYPLLYLPSYCSFRMTDIWRSFVAQRCLWAMGCGLVFHAAEADQQRNAHNLQRDFDDEVPGYTGNRRLCRVLDETELTPGPAAVGANALRCYERLIEAGFFPEGELVLLNAWLADLARVGRPPSPGVVTPGTRGARR